MKLNLITTTTTLVSLLMTSPARATGTFPTHCKPGEYPFLNARMATMEQDENGRLLNKKNGKILSLCSDRENEPFGKFVYRYGRPGEVEFERIASKQSQFFIYNRANSPRTGEDDIFFSIEPFTYYIVINGGQARGVYLVVHKSKKETLRLFSGTDVGKDYQLGTAYFSRNFNLSRSPVFIVKDPEIWFE